MSGRTSNPWKLSTFLLLAIVGLTVCLGFARPRPAVKTVEAEEFVLRDSDGKVRARIAMQGEQPKILIYDESGRAIWNAPNSGLTPLSIKP